MVDSLPGIRAVSESEEDQIWASGPDNQHRKYHIKGHIKSTATDAGNTNFTTTLRGGLAIAKKDSDGLNYPYVSSANDGTQGIVALLEKRLPMTDRDGILEDKMPRMLVGGIIRSLSDVINVDKAAMAVLLRTGFCISQKEPHGSAFLLQPRRRDFFAADYVVVDGDHGKLLVATAAVNFTLPSLATVGAGFEVQLFQTANANLVVTAAADTIIYDDTTNGKATTLTFGTASQKMGASVLMRSDYDSAGGTLSWYPMMIQRTAVAA